MPLVALIPLLVSIPMPADTRVPTAVTIAYCKALDPMAAPIAVPFPNKTGTLMPNVPRVNTVKAVAAAAISAVFTALAIYSECLCNMKFIYCRSAVI